MNQELLEQVKSCPSLPSLPAIAVQVLELAQKSDVDIGEIARLITKDPALSTKILRTVNSSFYGRSNAVSTISQALVILGLQSVKTLVLGFSLVSNLSKTKTKGFKHVHYWQRSIYAATAARVLAGKLGVMQQEEAFLCGLLKDIGMLVLDQVLGAKYGELFERAESHSALAELERAELGGTHADVGGILAEQWRLPPLLKGPIQFHHDLEQITDASVRKLATVVHLGGLCADVFVDANSRAAAAIVDVRAAAQSLFNLGEAELDALLGEIGTKTKEMAGLFEITIGAGVTFDAILKKAQDALVELTLQAQMQASQLQQQNQKLQERVITDALTGLHNRARFDEFLAEAFPKALEANGKPLSLIMIDIDRFKSINDTHGHPTGDAVLRALAKLVRAIARKTDLAARYGGEEFSLILPDTPRSTAATIAETLRRAVAAKPMVTPTATIPVTASFGVATAQAGSPLLHPSHLIKAADLALYHAKHSGRDNVKVFTPKPTAAAA